MRNFAAFLEDPYNVASMAGQYRDPVEIGGLMSYDTLRRMAAVPIIAAVVETRCNQVGEFAHRQTRKGVPGFKISLRESDRSPTNVELEEMANIEEWLDSCGDWNWMENEPRHKILRDRLTFEWFAKSIIRDSLRYDQASWEIVNNRLGKPLCWLPIDGATIRINSDASGFVQVVDGRVTAHWRADQLAFGIRRPRTDISTMGYGYPELIDLVEIVTGYIWGFQYNLNYFRQGANTKGMLLVNGPMNPAQLADFRRDWTSMVAGVEAAHQVPIINPLSKDSSVNWISLQKSNQDMEYREWMNWLLKIICAVYQVDPAEVGFQFGTEGQTSPVFMSNPETRIKMGKDKGLRPLLKSIATWVNKYLIWPRNPEFELQFEGLAEFREQEQAELDKSLLTSYVTVDEIRANHDLPPLPYGAGKIILHPTIQQWIQVLAMQGFLPLDKYIQKPTIDQETGKSLPQEDNEFMEKAKAAGFFPGHMIPGMEENDIQASVVVTPHGNIPLQSLMRGMLPDGLSKAA